MKLPVGIAQFAKWNVDEIFVAWGHARFGFFVKNFLTEKEK
jgi:hypothetical protein